MPSVSLVSLAVCVSCCWHLTFAAAGAQPLPQTEVPSAPSAQGPTVVLTTSLGVVRISLHADKAPRTVENFLRYVKSGFYNGTIFHRVISTFMVQGGGFTIRGAATGYEGLEEKSTDPPVALEARTGLTNVRGSVAMARMRQPDSATAQFFINVEDNPQLDFPEPDGFGYAVFGQVVGGMEVVDKMKAARTGVVEGMPNVPVTPIVIESIRLAETRQPTPARPSARP